jgi:hypothetical protein
MKYDKLLQSLYEDFSTSPAAFTGAEALYREAHERDASVKREDVQEFLQRHTTYTLHKRARRKFPRLPTLPAGLHTDWQADLCILASLARHNRGFRYLLVCVDVLSRQIFVEPVKTKRGEDMVIALRAIIKRVGATPWKVYSDEGKEFTAGVVQRFFKKRDMIHICLITSPLFHCGVVERANRTIKERLYRYFTHNNTHKWVDVIQPLVQAINRSPCTSIGGLRPVDVTFGNAAGVRKQLKLSRLYPPRRPSLLKKGDYVRIVVHKDVFTKGYMPNFSEEIYTITHVRKKRAPYTYRIRDGKGVAVRGLFYAPELCKVKMQMGDSWPIRVIERVKRSGSGKFFYQDTQVDARGIHKSA